MATKHISPAAGERVLLADACWLAVASLHHKHPDSPGFSAAEILQKLRQLSLGDYLPSSVHAHLYQHCVANVEPSSGRYRMLTRLPDGALRLFRPGDYAHPKRRGKVRPAREAIPREYQGLVDWYDEVYAPSAGEQEDPVLAMRGVGKELWRDVSGDAFVASLREGWE